MVDVVVIPMARQGISLFHGFFQILGQYHTSSG